MRRLILTMLLATTMATPALALRGEREGGWNRGNSGESRGRADRAQRAESAPAQAQPQAQAQAPEARPAPRMIVSGGAPPASAEGQARVERRGSWNGNPTSGGYDRRADPTGDAGAPGRWQGRRGRDGGATATPVVVEGVGTVAPDGRATDWGSRTRTVDGTNGGWTRTRDGRTAPGVTDGDRRTRDGRWTGTRDGRDGRNNDGRWRDGRGGDGRWTNDWRHDRRYDWRDYRSRNHSIFRLGRYYDPFGYGYQRLNIGFTLFSGYYQSNYWLGDPYQYRLPPAYGPYRWVRYYDDAVLVDIYSGEVVEVIQGFFW